MKILKLITLTLLTLLIVSCGTSSSESTFEQIYSDNNIHNEEDLKKLGIKKGKKYKVEGLNKANAAIFAFYKKPGEKEAIEYEIRFYENHNDAVNEGIPMAKERVGPEAKLKKEYASWDEGLKDARQCGGAGGGMSAGGSQAGGAGDHAVGSCSSPKYNEFFVFNNLVILCQGENEIESRDNCIDVIEILKVKED
tara:strand:- start:2880 stop:3464 length:585 start_codon:yes stop_codon:yes gene_type:complete